MALFTKRLLLEELFLELYSDRIEEHRFTGLFRRGFRLLGLNDKEAARVFNTSTNNIRRWLTGTIPPAYTIILGILCKEVGLRVDRLLKQEEEDLKWAQKVAEQLGVQDADTVLNMKWSELNRLLAEKGLVLRFVAQDKPSKKKAKRKRT